MDDKLSHLSFFASQFFTIFLNSEFRFLILMVLINYSSSAHHFLSRFAAPRATRFLGPASLCHHCCCTTTQQTLFLLVCPSSSTISASRNHISTIFRTKLPDLLPHHRHRSMATSSSADPKMAQNDQEEEEEDENVRARERLVTVPNLLSLVRIAATPLLGYLVVHQHFWPACILFTLTGLTDLLDGLIARHFPSQRSLFGSILDPLADKLLVSTLFITLTHQQLIPVPVTLVVFARDLCLILGYVVLRCRMIEPPLTVRRFFDSTVSAVRVRPTALSKFNTALQLALVSLSLASPCFDFVDHAGLRFLQFLTASTTICSGLQYAFHSGLLRVKRRGGKKNS